MNSRLLTDEEKRFNRVARQQRKDLQKAIRRRLLVLGTVRDPLLLLDEMALPGHKFCESFWRKDSRPVIQAIRELAALAVATDDPGGMKSTSQSPWRVVARPSRVLRAGKRGRVPPHILLPQPTFDEFLGVDRAVEVAVERLKDGADATSILLLLADPQATGLKVKDCGDLVQRLGMMTKDIANSAAELVEKAQAFQAGLADGRNLFHARITNGAVEPVQGDWIAISRPALLRLLPGLQIPNDLRHQQFLANLIVDQEGRPECLDVHSGRFFGLFRHPLR